MGMLIFAIIIILSFAIGYVIGKNNLFKRSKNITDNNEIREKQEQYAKIKKSFNELMNYDYDTAVRRDKYE